MATAAKHRQRSSYSYHNHMKDDVFAASQKKIAISAYVKHQASWLERFFRRFKKKGDK